MKVSCGLDFGTSNSALSVHTDGNIHLIDADPFNEDPRYLKSVLYFFKERGSDAQILTGEKAVQEYILNDAAGRYMQSIKTFLPDKTFTRTEIYNRTYQLEELIALILKPLKAKADAFAGEDVDSVVMGRPVVFSEDPVKDKLAEERLEKAARIAGFKEILFQFEPIAAGVSFEKEIAKGEEKIAMVGDFGGGTSDFTIIRLKGGNSEFSGRREDILSLGGIYIGGNLFDSDLMWEKVAHHFGKNVRVKSPMSNNQFGLSTTITSKLKMWHLIPHLQDPLMVKSVKEFKYLAKRNDKDLIGNLETLVRHNLGLNLYRAIEKSKIGLSTEQEALIRFLEYSLDISEKVQRDTFEQTISHRVKDIVSCMDKTLKDAGVKTVDTVFLTGGSSYIPSLRNEFNNRFGEDKVTQMDAFLSVAYGLGLSASRLF